MGVTSVCLKVEEPRAADSERAEAGVVVASEETALDEREVEDSNVVITSRIPRKRLTVVRVQRSHLRTKHRSFGVSLRWIDRRGRIVDVAAVRRSLERRGHTTGRCTVARSCAKVTADVHRYVAHREAEHTRVHTSRPLEIDRSVTSGWVAQNRITVRWVIGSLAADHDVVRGRRDGDRSQRALAVLSISLFFPRDSPSVECGSATVAGDIEAYDRCTTLTIDGTSVVEDEDARAVCGSDNVSGEVDRLHFVEFGGEARVDSTGDWIDLCNAVDGDSGNIAEVANEKERAASFLNADHLGGCSGVEAGVEVALGVKASNAERKLVIPPEEAAAYIDGVAVRRRSKRTNPVVEHRPEVRVNNAGIGVVGKDIRLINDCSVDLAHLLEVTTYEDSVADLCVGEHHAVEYHGKVSAHLVGNDRALVDLGTSRGCVVGKNEEESQKDRNE